MFEKLEMAPPDAIFGLEEAFSKDLNPAKVNLTVGVYQDESGQTPVFHAVKLAEARMLEEETSKSYLSIEGSPAFAAAVQELTFGAGHEIVSSGRAATAQTPGGTGGLRIAGELIKRVKPDARIWISDPTWPNHPNIFGAAGLEIETYPYFDPHTNSVSLDAMIAALEQAPQGDVVLLHGCCHNPTGADPSQEQWARIADVLEARGLLPLVDFAYQGLAEGMREDAAGVLTLCRPGREVLIVNSFAKNFGLYNERTGALTVVTPSRETAQITLSHVKKCIRANYSNPPAHGAAIIITILDDPHLRATWEEEVQALCERINTMRRRFVKALEARGVKRDFSFIEQQRGMFSFTSLTHEQVQALRETYGVYLVGSGRINVAGLNEKNLDTVCEAIAAVL